MSAALTKTVFTAESIERIRAALDRVGCDLTRYWNSIPHDEVDLKQSDRVATAELEIVFIGLSAQLEQAIVLLEVVERQLVSNEEAQERLS